MPWRRLWRRGGTLAGRRGAFRTRAMSGNRNQGGETRSRREEQAGQASWRRDGGTRGAKHTLIDFAITQRNQRAAAGRREEDGQPLVRQDAGGEGRGGPDPGQELEVAATGRTTKGVAHAVQPNATTHQASQHQAQGAGGDHQGGSADIGSCGKPRWRRESRNAWQNNKGKETRRH